MTITSLERFKEEITQVRAYLKHIHYVNDVLNSNFRVSNKDFKVVLDALKKHHIHFARDKKVFEYKATIISMYGLLEKYIEIWMKEYLDALSSVIRDYTKLSDKIKKEHFDLSLRLINTMSNRESAKYQHLTKEQVLSQLNQCITNPSSYKLNTEAFCILSGNLKHDKIVELFVPIDVKINDGLKRNRTLISYIEQEQQIENISNLNTNALYGTINDIVDRRNTIAHGSEVIDDLLDYSVLVAYIDFLEKYCQGIFEVLHEEFIKHEAIHSYRQIDKVHNVLNKSVLLFAVKNYTIKKGDMLIVKTANDNYTKKTIIDLQKNNVSYSVLTITEETYIGIKVEPTIHPNCTFYLEK